MGCLCFVRSKLEQGFTLIEVMLGLLVLGFGLLGYAQGQIVSVRASHNAYFLGMADLKNEELSERYLSCKQSVLCLQEELVAWNADLKKKLPIAISQVKKLGLDYQAEIGWCGASRLSACQYVARLLFR